MQNLQSLFSHVSQKCVANWGHLWHIWTPSSCLLSSCSVETWPVKNVNSVNSALQISHLNGFLVSWTFVAFLGVKNELLILVCFFPSCSLEKWSLKLVSSVNSALQTSHSNSFFLSWTVVFFGVKNNLLIYFVSFLHALWKHDQSKWFHL